MEIFQNVDIDIIRDRARTARCAYIEDMENKLVSFEKKMLSKGFKVFWVSKESDVVEAFLKLLPSGVHHHKVCFDLPIIPSEFANVKSIQKISTKEIETRTQSAHFLFTQADFAVVETGTLVLL